MGAVPGKGCACPDKTGKPELSDMAPTWLRPGIKFIYTAKAGDFYIRLKQVSTAFVPVSFPLFIVSYSAHAGKGRL